MSSARSPHRLFSSLPLLLLIGVLSLAPGARAQEPEHSPQQGEGAERENEEVRTVRRRLKIMRLAVDAFVRADKHDAAELVELAMHTRELAIEGARGAKAAEIAKAAPNRGQLAELLGVAANLYEQREMNEQAHALHDLAKVYADQWKRRQRAQDQDRVRERERQGGADAGLDSLQRRVKIIELARAAYDKSGHERNEQALAHAVHYGRLAIEGAGDEAIGEAAAKVPSKGNLVELLRGAHNIWAELGDEERAAACHKLAAYYAGQLQAQGEEVDEEQARDDEGLRLPEAQSPASIDDLGRRIEILRLAHGALSEANKPDAADMMKRVIHVAELQRDGAGQAAMAEAFEGLSMGNTIEFLQLASKLYAEWDKRERAAACNELAEYYARRGRERDQQQDREQLPDAEQVSGNLDDLEHRIEILRLARKAHAEAGDKANANTAERILHLAELQREGANGEALARAAEGLTQETLIEIVARAQQLYAEWGHERSSAACGRLANFYRQRAAGQEGGEEHEAPRERPESESDDEATVRELEREVESLRRELAELKQILRKLVDK